MGTPWDDSVGIDAGSVRIHEFDGSAWVLQDTITASDGMLRQGFGGAVALSGTWLAVSAHGDAVGNPTFVPVYMFQLQGDDWIEIGRISPSNRPRSAFGDSLSLDGDTLVIGSPFQRRVSGGGETGAAFVEIWRGGAWVEQAVLYASAFQDGARFGGAVDLSGDRLIVGAWAHDVGALNACGAAFVFGKSGDSWIEEAALLPPSPQANADFGSAVALAGDVAVVGIPQHTNANLRDGAAVVYARAGTWLPSAELFAPGGEPSEFFGRAVDVSGDWIAVGAPQRHRGSINPGGVLVFVADPGGGWPLAQDLWATDPQDYDHFGEALDWGATGLAVGAYHEDGDNPLQSGARGAAYVFTCVGEPPEVSAPSSRSPLLVSRTAGTLTLSFEDLGVLAEGYSIYEGGIGNWYSHAGVLCNQVARPDGRPVALALDVPDPSGNRYWLVTCALGAREGTAGSDSFGRERPPALNDCPP